MLVLGGLDSLHTIFGNTCNKMNIMNNFRAWVALLTALLAFHTEPSMSLTRPSTASSETKRLRVSSVFELDLFITSAAAKPVRPRGSSLVNRRVYKYSNPLMTASRIQPL